MHTPNYLRSLGLRGCENLMGILIVPDITAHASVQILSMGNTGLDIDRY